MTIPLNPDAADRVLPTDIVDHTGERPTVALELAKMRHEHLLQTRTIEMQVNIALWGLILVSGGAAYVHGKDIPIEQWFKSNGAFVITHIIIYLGFSAAVTYLHYRFWSRPINDIEQHSYGVIGQYHNIIEDLVGIPRPSTIRWKPIVPAWSKIMAGATAVFFLIVLMLFLLAPPPQIAKDYSQHLVLDQPIPFDPLFIVPLPIACRSSSNSSLIELPSVEFPEGISHMNATDERIQKPEAALRHLGTYPDFLVFFGSADIRDLRPSDQSEYRSNGVLARARAETVKKLLFDYMKYAPHMAPNTVTFGQEAAHYGRAISPSDMAADRTVRIFAFRGDCESAANRNSSIALDPWTGFKE